MRFHAGRSSSLGGEGSGWAGAKPGGATGAPPGATGLRHVDQAGTRTSVPTQPAAGPALGEETSRPPRAARAGTLVWIHRMPGVGGMSRPGCPCELRGRNEVARTHRIEGAVWLIAKARGRPQPRLPEAAAAGRRPQAPRPGRHSGQVGLVPGAERRQETARDAEQVGERVRSIGPSRRRTVPARIAAPFPSGDGPRVRWHMAHADTARRVAQVSGLRGSRRSLMIRFWISLVPSKIVVSRASRQCRSTCRSVV